MRKHPPLLSVALFLWAATTWADCNKTTSDYDVVYCGTKLYLQADKELNDVYPKLLAKLNTDGKQLLKTGQLAWIEGRNRQCSETRRGEHPRRSGLCNSDHGRTHPNSSPTGNANASVRAV